MINTPPGLDLCVIGASEAGIAACVAAVALGLSVVLVDGGDPDGSGHPDLVLERLRAAALDRRCDRDEGCEAWPAVAASRPRRAAAADRRHARLAAMNVRVVAARARFADRSSVVAGAMPITPRRTIIAVGGRQPAASIAACLEPARCLTVDRLDGLSGRPDSIVILGGGAEAVSAAQSLRRLGSETVLVADRLLPGLDDDLAAPLLGELARDGVRVLAGVRPRLCRRMGAGLSLMLTDGTVLEGSHLLLAAETEPALDDLDLDRAGIATAGSALVLDPQGRTTNRRVFAVGRAAGAASTAAGVAAVGAVLRAAFFPLPTWGRPPPVASVTATDPQVATVGLSESAAAARGAVHVWRWPLAHTGAGALGPTPSGFVKVVTSRRGTILGAGLVGPDVREMLAFWSLAVARRSTLSQLAGVAVPTPSFSEAARALALSHLAGRLAHPMVRRALRLARWFG